LDGFDLALALGRADDKIIGEGRLLANIQQNDVFTLFIRDGFDDTVCKFDEFQSILLLWFCERSQVSLRKI
jgi:hypothetical protein